MLRDDCPGTAVIVNQNGKYYWTDAGFMASDESGEEGHENIDVDKIETDKIIPIQKVKLEEGEPVREVRKPLSVIELEDGQ